MIPAILPQGLAELDLPRFPPISLPKLAEMRSPSRVPGEELPLAMAIYPRTQLVGHVGYPANLRSLLRLFGFDTGCIHAEGVNVSGGPHSLYGEANLIRFPHGARPLIPEVLHVPSAA